MLITNKLKLQELCNVLGVLLLNVVVFQLMWVVANLIQ